MRSGPAEVTGTVATILCPDLAAGPACSEALTLARWLVDRHGPGAVDTIALWGGGGWQDAFAALGPVWQVNDIDPPATSGRTLPLDLAQFGGRSARGPRPAPVIDQLAGGTAWAFRAAGLRRPADAVRGGALRRRLGASTRPIWLAGAAGARLLHYVPSGRRVVVHQGEFEPAPDQVVTNASDLRLLLDRPDGWVAGSGAAADRLRALGVRSAITTVPDLVETAVNAGAAAIKATRQWLATVGVPVGAPLVVSPGELDWWDLPDSFVQVAWEIRRRGADVHLVWTGGHATERMLWPLRHDIAHAGLAGHVHVAPAGLRPADALAAADVIAVTRRGALQPAQIREIEAVGVPVVRYALPGEPIDVRRVEFLDEPGLADAALAVLGDPDAGAAARAVADRVRARHAVDDIGPVLLGLLLGHGSDD